jgi:hypothetical protein
VALYRGHFALEENYMSVISRISSQNSGTSDIIAGVLGYVAASLVYLAAHFTSPLGTLAIVSVPAIFGSLLIPHEPALKELITSRFAKAFGIGCLLVLIVVGMSSSRM